MCLLFPLWPSYAHHNLWERTSTCEKLVPLLGGSSHHGGAANSLAMAVAVSSGARSTAGAQWRDGLGTERCRAELRWPQRGPGKARLSVGSLPSVNLHNAVGLLCSVLSLKGSVCRRSLWLIPTKEHSSVPCGSLFLYTARPAHVLVNT